MPLLRGHHLVCLHFFNGEGYDAAFIKSLEDTLRRAKDEDVDISSGADDVCTACLHLKHGRCMQTENADEEICGMDAKALKLLGFSVSDRVTWKVLKDSTLRILPEWYSLYCTGCAGYVWWRSWVYLV